MKLHKNGSITLTSHEVGLVKQCQSLLIEHCKKDAVLNFVPSILKDYDFMRGTKLYPLM